MSLVRLPIEVLATSVGAARLALLGGADRIELCENDPQGGTTPSAGTIDTVLALAEPHGTPVHVMIRPRARTRQPPPAAGRFSSRFITRAAQRSTGRTRGETSVMASSKSTQRNSLCSGRPSSGFTGNVTSTVRVMPM